tara:strand:- start:516 stop:674 length:159 start_codon:yes stop_codon:yes gene_type:complete
MKLKNEIRLSIYTQLIESVMENVEDYETLPSSIKLQLNIAMRKSMYLVPTVD